MNLPFFYTREYDRTQEQLTLDEDTSRHVIQVLRMKTGEKLNLTDGKGSLLACSITGDHKKHCTVRVNEVQFTSPREPRVAVAISLLKNSSRFEWFLEKATEIGISEIIPLVCKRTEKEKFRFDRMQQICTSAMLQSQQVWLPVLHQPLAFDLLFRQEEVVKTEKKFVAHCLDSGEKTALSSYSPFHSSAIILVGPEGDFTPDEIAMALHHAFLPVSLGETRLRTETAGLVAAALLRQG